MDDPNNTPKPPTGVNEPFRGASVKSFMNASQAPSRPPEPSPPVSSAPVESFTTQATAWPPEPESPAKPLNPVALPEKTDPVVFDLTDEDGITVDPKAQPEPIPITDGNRHLVLK